MTAADEHQPVGQTYHSFRLPDGTEITGQADTFKRFKALHLPADLSGYDVLDIGCHEGFFSFECERLGARSVVAADKITWDMFPEHRATFDRMHAAFDSSVRVVESSVEDLAATLGRERFNLTLFLGVLYHAPDPFEYLRIVKSVSSGLVVLETVVDFLDVDLPVLAYYPSDRYNGDSTNVTAPNLPALRAMMEDVGFHDITMFEPHEKHRVHQLHASAASEYPRSLRSKITSRLMRPTVSGRIVVHARAD